MTKYVGKSKDYMKVEVLRRRARSKIRFNYCIFIFILLTRRKATKALVHRISNYPTCFRGCQDTAGCEKA